MMNIIHKIFSMIDWVIKIPKSYGWFHLMSITLMVLITVLIAKAVKKNPDKVVKKTLTGFVVISLVLEVIKQGLFTHEASSYQWYAFPFQFCSTPMYISLMALIVRNKKIKEAFYSFLALYGLFGGLVVMIYPNDVFTYFLMIDIQTMVHHGGMFVIGCILIISNKVNLNFKGFLKATYVFIGLVITALILNVIVYKEGIGSFNMFFISPYGTCHLPILSIIQAKFPYAIFLSSYVLGFGFAGFVVQRFAYLISRLFIYVGNHQKIKKINASRI